MFYLFKRKYIVWVRLKCKGKWEIEGDHILIIIILLQVLSIVVDSVVVSQHVMLMDGTSWGLESTWATSKLVPLRGSVEILRQASPPEKVGVPPWLWTLRACNFLRTTMNFQSLICKKFCINSYCYTNETVLHDARFSFSSKFQ